MNYSYARAVILQRDDNMDFPETGNRFTRAQFLETSDEYGRDFFENLFNKVEEEGLAIH